MKKQTLSLVLLISLVGCASKEVQPDPKPMTEAPAAPAANADEAIVDIRPADFQREASEKEQLDGKATLEKMIAAHGGLEAFNAKGIMKTMVSDDWTSAIPAMAGANPWAGKKQNFVLTQMPNRLDGSILLTDGSQKGLRYTTDNDKGFWESQDGGEMKKSDKRFDFSIKAQSFFAQAPFQLAYADVVAALSPVTKGEVTYERVYATWKNAAPQSDTDQYIAWIDSSTNRLTHLQFTVRDMSGSLAAAIQYHDHKSADGIWFPQKMRIVSEFDGPTILHDISLTSVEFMGDAPSDHMVPGSNPASSMPASSSQPAN